MLTKWAKKLIAIPTDNSVAYYTAAVGCIKCKNVYGDDCIIGPRHSTDNPSFLTSIIATGNASSTGIAVGSGTTPATEDDYNIESILTSLKCASLSVDKSYDSTAGKLYYFVNLALTNPTAEAITVTEVCRFAQFFKVTNFGDSLPTAGSSGISILIDRIVLDTPLIIPANESAILRYRFGYDVDKPEV